MTSIVAQTSLPLTLFRRGKVRDTYDLDGRLLIVATDRISAFDVVLPLPIAFKGHVLNQLSAFWFEKTSHLMVNHYVKSVFSANDLLPQNLPAESFRIVSGRSMVVSKAKRLPVEFVVRGYLSGSAWAEYKSSGTVCGTKLPHGLRESEKLAHPIFTPTTKAEHGHDEPLSNMGLVEVLGQKLAEELERKSLNLYSFAEQYALQRGIIIADTKFEFGLVDDKPILIDELLTPDSSRFWQISQYSVGRPQDSYDKQPVRDWLLKAGWNKQPPAPDLPPEIIEQTSNRYRDVYFKLTGKELQV